MTADEKRRKLIEDALVDIAEDQEQGGRDAED